MAASIKNYAEEISAPGKKAKSDETQSPVKCGKQQIQLDHGVHLHHHAGNPHFSRGLLASAEAAAGEKGRQRLLRQPNGWRGVPSEEEPPVFSRIKVAVVLGTERNNAVLSQG